MCLFNMKPLDMFKSDELEKGVHLRVFVVMSKMAPQNGMLFFFYLCLQRKISQLFIEWRNAFK